MKDPKLPNSQAMNRSPEPDEADLRLPEGLQGELARLFGAEGVDDQRPDLDSERDARIRQEARFELRRRRRSRQRRRRQVLATAVALIVGMVSAGIYLGVGERGGGPMRLSEKAAVDAGAALSSSPRRGVTVLGDLDGNSQVDVLDALILARQIELRLQAESSGATGRPSDPEFELRADLDANGRIDRADLEELTRGLVRLDGVDPKRWEEAR